MALINILLVDDHDLVRAGIRSLLEDEQGMRVVGEASSGEEALKKVKELDPTVVLMDVRMPGMGGLEATRKMIRLIPGVKIIALTVCNEEPFPSKLLQAGAQGYITKGSTKEEVVRAIHAVAHTGRRYMSPDVAQQLALRHLSDEKASPLESISERELQVLLMITRGFKVQLISDQLCLSPKTVNSYRYRLFEKLHVRSDVELTHFALKHGLLDSMAISDSADFASS